ncbi:hypothetical protein CAOG_02834 [Capsaspora owczarzaki ATCC 30864]|uniref:DUF5898 domain-containing protein n=1 Tax=Capsaspora owczarzaki (strain ATCC 30864) TaxID=595528 RepID=A0A0D2WLZ9_CAPO3|nr:hypothetical protein CAOG_02834 [Capsaspora owczarzaki ATCC 30864]KJE91740.1 hypothetical protein CAOG_002834 [Capsaspora owczarzaki ATCC 30864]|eukprot:XP_004348647.2 hypothetical protein CAOG_02834 [Capsaspora owczarzaki ATCC 30864]
MSSQDASHGDQGLAAAAPSDPMHDLAACLGLVSAKSLAPFSPRLPNVNLATQRSGLLAALPDASTIKGNELPQLSDEQRTNAAAVLNELGLPDTSESVPHAVGFVLLKTLLRELKAEAKAAAAEQERQEAVAAAAEKRADNERNEKLKAEAAAEAKAAAAETARQKAVSRASEFLLDKDIVLPALGPANLGKSNMRAFVSAAHKAAVALHGEFGVHTDLEYTARPADALHDAARAGYDGEAAVRLLVYLTLTAVAKVLGQHQLGEIPYCFKTAGIKLSAANAAQDLWHVSWLGIGHGALVIKKPSAPEPTSSPKYEEQRKQLALEDSDNPLILGQLYDYLQELRITYNLNSVFGILTNYMYWRICWLDDAASNELAACRGELIRCGESTAHELDQHASFPLSQFAATQVTATPFPPPTQQREPLKRELRCSQPFYYRDKEIVSVIASALYKMSRIVPIRGRCHTALAVTSKSYAWESFKMPLDFHHMPTIDKASNRLYLTLRLGGGGDGTAWLASNAAGRVCVVKFFNEPNLEDIQAECNRWNDIWHQRDPQFPEAVVVTLLQQPVLVMPFVKTGEFPKQVPADARKAIREAAQRMATAGYMHDDLLMRHVGFYTKASNTLMAVFCDLSRVTRVSSATEKEDAWQTMLANLSRELKVEL